MKRSWPPTPLVWLTVSTGQVPVATSNKLTWNLPQRVTILEAQVAAK